MSFPDNTAAIVEPPKPPREISKERPPRKPSVMLLAIGYASAKKKKEELLKRAADEAKTENARREDLTGKEFELDNLVKTLQEILVEIKKPQKAKF